VQKPKDVLLLGGKIPLHNTVFPSDQRGQTRTTSSTLLSDQAIARLTLLESLLYCLDYLISSLDSLLLQTYQAMPKCRRKIVRDMLSDSTSVTDHRSIASIHVIPACLRYTWLQKTPSYGKWLLRGLRLPLSTTTRRRGCQDHVRIQKCMMPEQLHCSHYK
jgi:hypothetical protein